MVQMCFSNKHLKKFDADALKSSTHTVKLCQNSIIAWNFATFYSRKRIIHTTSNQATA